MAEKKKKRSILDVIINGGRAVKDAPKKKAKKLGKQLLPKHNLQDIRKVRENKKK